MRRDIEHIPPKYLSNTSGGVQAPNHLVPIEQLFLFSRWAGKCGLKIVVWLCIHWVVQDTKQQSFLIYVGGVYTTNPFLLLKGVVFTTYILVFLFFPFPMPKHYCIYAAYAWSWPALPFTGKH
jgi:hypothetical protein